MPVAVYNYLDRPQTVELTLRDAAWFKRLGKRTQKTELAAGEVRSVGYRLRAEKVGRFELEVAASGSGVADALRRPIEVRPDGQPVERVFNGTLQQPAQIACFVPPQAIEGSAKAVVKIYASSFSQIVEGLDAIFQRPYGCFEQTSSTTYPNVLALDYLRQNKKSLPAVEAKAREYILLGYQRLLSFEIPGGGFDWFGRPPANRTLTAYGLMEFRDMARVHDVDANLIERTRRWLLGQRLADGSWAEEDRMLHDGLAREMGPYARLGATAYIAWAVFGGGGASDESRETRQFLLAQPPEAIGDAYVLALVANALLALDPSGADAAPYLDRLEGLKRLSPDEKSVWWDGPASRTVFYGAGRSGSVETTSLAALAMLQAGYHPLTARGALRWLAAQRDGNGTWDSTQATVMALKALLAGAGKPMADRRPQRLEIRCDSRLVRDLAIPAEQADVVQQLDLSPWLATGRHRLTIADRSDTAAVYQVVLRYHLPSRVRETRDGAGETRDSARETPQEMPDAEVHAPYAGLSIDIAYDRTNLAVNDTVQATATVANKTAQAAPMVILDLPLPAGFALESEDLEKLVAAGPIAKYQLTPRSAIVYLRQLPPDEPLVLHYRLRATMPVKITVPPARAYEYYDPERQVSSAVAYLTVAAQ